MPVMPHGRPYKWVNHGQSRTGPARNLSGVALAQTGPGVPLVPRTNLVRDQSGNVIWVVREIHLGSGDKDNLGSREHRGKF